MLGNGRDGREDIVVNNHHECIGRNTTSPVVPTAGSRPQLARRLSDLSVKVGTRTRFLVEVISATPVNVSICCKQYTLYFQGKSRSEKGI